MNNTATTLTNEARIEKAKEVKASVEANYKYASSTKISLWIKEINGSLAVRLYCSDKNRTAAIIVIDTAGNVSILPQKGFSGVPSMILPALGCAAAIA